MDILCAKNGLLAFFLGCSLLVHVDGKWSRFLVNNDPISCDFEAGFCGYTQQHNDNYDWSIGTGETRSHHTGPMADHSTNKNGHYAFVDSSEHNPGKTARIISPFFQNPTYDHYRVEFWYDMEGRDIGELNVYVRSYGRALGMPLLSLTGEQDHGWQRVCMDIPHDDENDRFQVIFEGTGYGNAGDTAIDDVKLSHGSCNIATRNISCNFDKDNCGYFFDSESNFEWNRHRGGTSTGNTGPPSDHTTGSGYYVYTEASEGHPDDAAAMISPSFETADQHLSVKFWYSMYGHDMGELNVFFIMGEWESDESFYKGGSKGYGWHYGCVDLPLYTHNIRLIFEAIKGYGKRGDIAVDDITLQYGFCKESHSTPSVTTGTTPKVMSGTTPPHTTKGPSSHWSRWSGYSACSVTCGSSVIRTSYRTCVGGSSCPGSATRTQSCNLPHCIGPVDGGWSVWSIWSSCSKSCDLGQISRARSCDNPTPSHGGKDCQGNKDDIKDCTMGQCPSWTHWFEGPCSSSCSNGTRERLRTCSSGHREDCPGISYELVPCVGVVCIE